MGFKKFAPNRGVCYIIPVDLPERISEVLSILLEVEEVFLMKRTYQPHNTRRKRGMGFLVRSRSASGRRILKNRRRRGRARLAV